jgi:DNA-binding winged helix-turn-helix (wHTH) protein/TolB-like protein/Tfp pilus assembly protein PilF
MESQRPPASFRIGEFELDAVGFRVLRNGTEVPLEPKAVDVLLYLAQRPGQLVSKEALLAAVWNGAAVTDNALARVIAQLRRTLGDEAHHPRFIETVPTRGYRFIGRPAGDPLASGRRAPAAETGMTMIPRYLGVAAAIAVASFVLLAWSIGILRRSAAGEKPEQAALNGTAPQIRSLAVLPLKNYTGDVGQDYFVEGMSQALRDTFAQSGVTVAPATSSRRYTQASLTPNQISRELNVDALIEGAVLSSRGQVRISVGLIHGASGRTLWSATYERPLADVLTLYSDIALTAASEMNVAVAAGDGARIRRHKPVVPEAYDHYLKGVYFAGNRWMAGGCREAEASLQRAISADPTFAPSYAVLAWCYAYPDRTGRSIEDVGPKAKALVAKALALDDRLPMAHVVRGTIKWRVDYDPAAAEIDFKKAIALDPSAGLAYVPYAEHLIWWQGERDEGLRLLKRAAELDPFSPERRVQVGFVLLAAGLYDSAIDELKKSLELDSNYLTARLWLAEAYGFTGLHDAAVSEYLRWLDGVLVPARSVSARSTLERAYAEGGWSAFWRRELELSEEDARQRGTVWRSPYDRYTGPWYMARRYARLGDASRALDALEAAYRERHHLVATLAVEPLFRQIRGDPRFGALVRLTAAVRSSRP